jgi:hypothetical protein
VFFASLDLYSFVLNTRYNYYLFFQDVGKYLKFDMLMRIIKLCTVTWIHVNQFITHPRKHCTLECLKK